jgi:tetratricopeptide (TPR) repeat protein
MINGVKALANVERDHLDEARQLLAGFVAAGMELSLNPAWVNAMVAYAEVAIACKDPQSAEPLFDRLAPWVDQLSTNGGTAVDGPVSHYLGGLANVLGRYDDADAYFTRASAFNERAKAKFFAARTNLAWGHMLVERHGPGDVEKARALLTEAHTAASVNGYANVERRAAQALQEID